MVGDSCTLPNKTPPSVLTMCNLCYSGALEPDT